MVRAGETLAGRIPAGIIPITGTAEQGGGDRSEGLEALETPAGWIREEIRGRRNR